MSTLPIRAAYEITVRCDAPAHNAAPAKTGGA